MPSFPELQQWFAGCITAPLGNTPEEAAEHILPSHRMNPQRRLEIYQQQYWWRLLACLHEQFPLLTRLFGYEAFNHSIAIPYLTESPSTHWSLEKLGGRLPQWIEKHYHEADRNLILFSAQIDLAWQELFIAPWPQPLVMTPDLLTKKLTLQPHVRVYPLPFDLLTFRKALLKEEVDFWSEAPFPRLSQERDYYFLLYRTQHYSVTWREIDACHALFLQMLSSGSTIEEVCLHLEKTDSQYYELAKTSLLEWTQLWSREHFLC